MSYTTFSPMMEDIKPEEAGPHAWQGYQNPLQMPSRLPPSYDIARQGSSLVLPSHGALKGTYQPMHVPPHMDTQSPSPQRREQASAPRPSLSTQHSHQPSKRPYETYEDCSYITSMPENYECLQDIDNNSKPTMQADHRLLSFDPLQSRHTVLDQYGRPSNIDVTAQIHGMFFLSEIATNTGESIIIQPELTCYRRNLFQISGSVTCPSGNVSVVNERGEAISIVAQELSLSAMESVDGHVIRLIVIPWKTPPPNSPEVPPNHEQEPPPIPLVYNGNRNQNRNSNVTVQPIAWRRLQFRVATANNGRRKELQQHFVLRLTVTATLADGSKLSIGESTTAPIVVRGRSPRNFQTRKEIPLVGSSASPRGQSSHASPVERKTQLVSDALRAPKPDSIELPKRPYQFDASSFPPSPLLLRHNYTQWNASQTQEHGTATTPTYPPPQVSFPAYLTTAVHGPDISRMNIPPILSPPLSELNMNDASSRPPFYHPLTASSVHFLDSNPRPSKSPRHVVPPDLPLYSPFEERMVAQQQQPQQYVSSSHSDHAPDYFPTAAWTTSAEQHTNLYTTTMPPPPQQQFAFPSELFVKDESSQQQTNYRWSSA